MKLIGITGKARAGKDTLADIIVRKYRYKQRAFGDKLKEIALAINPILESAGGNEYMDWPELRLQDLVNEVGWEKAKEDVPEVRRLLQVIGTEAGRNIFGEDVWVNLLFSDMPYASDSFVISDVRFPNEVNFLKKIGGTIIKVIRPNFDNGVGTGHASESFIEGLVADYEVMNDGLISDLDGKVDEIIEKIDDYSNTRP